MRKMECLTKREELSMQENPSTFTFRSRSFQSIVDELVEGIKQVYEEAPPKLTTFEEIGNWAGQHVLLTEEKITAGSEYISPFYDPNDVAFKKVDDG